MLQSLIPLLDAQVPYYWTSEGKAEVEFVIQSAGKVIPVEVKAEGNISGNSLSVYTKKFNPEYRLRFSMLNLQYNDGLLSCPSPLAAWFPKFLSLVQDAPAGESS